VSSAFRLLLLLATAMLLAAACGDPQDEPDAAQLEHGAQLYDAYCYECHGGATGGSIADIPPPHNAEGHTWHHGDCQLVDNVLEGILPRPGAEGDQIMPAFGDELTEQDVEAILAHIKTWWTEEQREIQAGITEQVCPGE
jgi:mono/diheme cytochrome c family protein